MLIKNLLSLLLVTITTFNLTFAQEDLLQQLEQEAPKEKELTTASFKGTRIINSHSLEVVGRKGFEFRIAHRFGALNTGAYNLFGLDDATSIKLSFDYSFNGRWMIGFARNSYGKLYEGLVKYRILRQTTDNSMPLSLTWLSIANITALKTSDNRYQNFSNRLSFVHQAILGRKFNDWLTLQMSPTFIHYNLIEGTTTFNDIYSVVGAGRLKFTRSMALTLEYGYRLNNYTGSPDPYYNTFGIGLDIETGGHVFQIVVVNSPTLNEAQFIPFTAETWNDGGMRLGFNISRVFGTKWKN